MTFCLCVRGAQNHPTVGKKKKILVNAKATRLLLCWWQVHWIRGWGQGAQEEEPTTGHFFPQTWGLSGYHSSLEALRVSD